MENNLIYERMAKISQEIKAIGKLGENQHQKYKYRRLDDIYDALHPLLAKHEVFIMPEVLESKTEERLTKGYSGNEPKTMIYRILRIKYTFYTIDGSNVSAVLEGEGADLSDKGTNKAMSAAQKYLFVQSFAIAGADIEDGDSETIIAQPAMANNAQTKAQPAKKQQSHHAQTRHAEWQKQAATYDPRGEMFGGLADSDTTEQCKKIITETGQHDDDIPF